MRITASIKMPTTTSSSSAPQPKSPSSAPPAKNQHGTKAAQNHHSSSIVKVHDPPSLGPRHPIYSNVTVVPLSDTVKLVTTAGQVAVPLDSWQGDSSSVPRTLAAQIDLCLLRLAACLEYCGARRRDVSRLAYYFTERAWNQEDAAALLVNKLAVWLEGHRPASACLVVQALSQPEFMCEFEAQAVVRS